MHRVSQNTEIYSESHIFFYIQKIFFVKKKTTGLHFVDAPTATRVISAAKCIC